MAFFVGGKDGSAVLQSGGVELLFSDEIEINGVIEVIDVLDDAIGPVGSGGASDGFEDKRGTGGLEDVRIGFGEA